MSAPPSAESGDSDAREQSFLSHLVELRARLLRAVLAVLGVFVCLIPFANRLYALLAAPLLEKLPQGTKMVAIDVASPFFVPVKLAFFAAVGGGVVNAPMELKPNLRTRSIMREAKTS